MFEEASVSLAEIAEEFTKGIVHESVPPAMPKGLYPSATGVGPGMSAFPAFERLGIRWEGFIDSLMAEWQTLNIVSGLLLSYVVGLSFLQKEIDIEFQSDYDDFSNPSGSR